MYNIVLKININMLYFYIILVIYRISAGLHAWLSGSTVLRHSNLADS